MVLERPGSRCDAWRLGFSPRELSEAYAPAQYAKAGIAYDAGVAYVAQVFVYIFLQPRDLIKDPDTQGALAALDHLAKGGAGVLQLPKAQMRQLLTIPVMAAESEEQVNPEKVQFPDLEFPGDTYAKVFETLLSALTMTGNRPSISFVLRATKMCGREPVQSAIVPSCLSASSCRPSDAYWFRQWLRPNKRRAMRASFAASMGRTGRTTICSTIISTSESILLTSSSAVRTRSGFGC